MRQKKVDNRGNVRTIAGCKPIDSVNDDLIDLSLMGKIRIKGVNGRNGMNG